VQKDEISEAGDWSLLERVLDAISNAPVHEITWRIKRSARTRRTSSSESEEGQQQQQQYHKHTNADAHAHENSGKASAAENATALQVSI